VEVGIPFAQVDKALPHLARLPHLRAVQIRCVPGDCDWEGLDAAKERVKRAVPGVQIPPGALILDQIDDEKPPLRWDESAKRAAINAICGVLISRAL
jgi:hypothetical protein